MGSEDREVMEGREPGEESGKGSEERKWASKRECVEELYSQGRSVSEIARECKTSEDYVRKVVSMMRKERLGGGGGSRYVEADVLRLLRTEFAEVLRPLVENEALMNKVFMEVGRHTFLLMFGFASEKVGRPPLDPEELRKISGDPKKLADVVIEKINALVEWGIEGASIVETYASELKRCAEAAKKWRDLALNAISVSQKLRILMDLALASMDSKSRYQFAQALAIKYAFETPSPPEGQVQNEAGKRGEAE